MENFIWGGQKKLYKDTLKVFLKDFNIPPESWEQIALDRAKWRCLIRQGTDDYGAKSVYERERTASASSGRRAIILLPNESVTKIS